MKGIHAVAREGSQIGSGCDESLEAVRRVGLSGHVSSSETFGGDRIQACPGAKQEGHDRNIIAHRSAHQRSESKDLRLVGIGARFQVRSDEVGVTRFGCFGKIAAWAASALGNQEPDGDRKDGNDHACGNSDTRLCRPRHGS